MTPTRLADLNEMVAATPTTAADPARRSRDHRCRAGGAAADRRRADAGDRAGRGLGAPTHVVADALAELVAFYDETGRGFELRQIGGGWRYYTREEHAELVGRYLLDGQQAKLSQAALETLAVVAYQQPISRARISAVRGVSVDGVMRTLLTRGLVAEAGHDHESGAILFRTTGYFLERMGLRSLDDLPALAPHLPEVDELEAELSQLARPQAVPERTRSGVRDGRGDTRT